MIPHPDDSPSLVMTFVRHGQTACSVADVYCGRHCDPSLTPEGHKTARALAHALGAQSWDGLYTSPLVRAQQTIMPLAEQTGLVPTLVAALSELDYGDWDGAQKAYLQARFPQAFAAWHAAPSQIAPPGGESVHMLWRRTSRALERIVSDHSAAKNAHVSAAKVLVVSHKSTLRVALCGLLGLDLDRFRERVTWPLGAVAQVAFSASGAKLVRFDGYDDLVAAALVAPDPTP